MILNEVSVSAIFPLEWKLQHAVVSEVAASTSSALPIWFLLAVGTSTLILAFLFCRGSISRVACLAILSVTVLPLLPGFTEQRQPQISALLLLTGLLLASAFTTARARGQSVKLASVWFGVVSVLSILTVGLIELDIFRLLVGLLTATVMALAITVGNAASLRELNSIRNLLTCVGCLAALIAVIEYVNKSPFYLFTDFQEPGNSYAVFRASAFLGHPLVLCAFLSGVAILNLSWTAQGSLFKKILHIGGIVLPLAGASATVSRGMWMFIAVGIAGVLIARAHSVRSKNTAILVAATAIVGATVMSFGEGFGQRFGELSAEDQRIRLGGLQTVGQITTEHEIVLGAGPKAVAKAYTNNVEGVIYGTVDNQFFTMYAEYGLVGLALLVALCVVLFKGIRSEGLDSAHRSFVLAALPPAAGFFLMEPVAWPLLCLIFGVGVGVANRCPKKTTPLLLGSQPSHRQSLAGLGR